MFNITKQFLDENPNAVFVFGDNWQRKGYGGAAALRDHPQAYGFVTKKYPDNKDQSFFKPEEYKDIFETELINLVYAIQLRPDKIFYISKLGSGLANKYKIWEEVIEEGLKLLESFENVRFCYKD